MKVAIIVACDLFTKHSYGGKQCALGHVKLLEELFGKQQVKVFSFTAVWPQKSNTQHRGMQIYPAPKSQIEMAKLALQRRKVISRAVERQLIKEIEMFSPDLLWIDSSQLGRLLKYNWAIPTIVFYHNIEQLYAKNKVVHEGPIYLPSDWAAKYNGRLAAKKAGSCICLNQRDGNLLEELYQRKADMILPIYLEDCVNPSVLERERTNRGGKKLLFVGSKFPPNVQGIHWFIQNVMPQLPECVLEIVGKGFEELKNQLTRSNVKVIGGVDSLEPYYENAAAVVMPILYGDGMKVKTAEAMMYGKVIFASEEALEGYRVEKLEGVFCCTTAEEFVRKIRENVLLRESPHYNNEIRKYFLDNCELGSQKNRLATHICSLITQKSL